MSTLGDRPAFPSPELYATEGMSLRAWLAGQALAGLSASPEWATRVGKGKNAGDIDVPMQEVISRVAVWISDATLKELAKEGR